MEGRVEAGCLFPGCRFPGCRFPGQYFEGTLSLQRCRGRVPMGTGQGGSEVLLSRLRSQKWQRQPRGAREVTVGSPEKAWEGP